MVLYRNTIKCNETISNAYKNFPIEKLIDIHNPTFNDNDNCPNFNDK